MAKYEDGSYGSAAGIALIAKVLAGRCAMKYTCLLYTSDAADE